MWAGLVHQQRGSDLRGRPWPQTQTSGQWWSASSVVVILDPRHRAAGCETLYEWVYECCCAAIQPIGHDEETERDGTRRVPAATLVSFSFLFSSAAAERDANNSLSILFLFLSLLAAHFSRSRLDGRAAVAAAAAVAGRRKRLMAHNSFSFFLSFSRSPVLPFCRSPSSSDGLWRRFRDAT